MNFVKLSVQPDAKQPTPANAHYYINLAHVLRIDSDASGSMLWLSAQGDAVVRVTETAEQIFELSLKPVAEIPRKSASILGS